MKKGDKVKFSLAWRRIVCENHMEYIYKDDVKNLNNISTIIGLKSPNYNSDTEKRWIIRLDDGYSFTYHHKFLRVVEK